MPWPKTSSCSSHRRIPTSTCVATAIAFAATIALIQTRARLHAVIGVRLQEAITVDSNPCCEMAAPPRVTRASNGVSTTWPEVVLSAHRVDAGVAPVDEKQALLDRMMTPAEAKSLLGYLSTTAANQALLATIPDTPEGL